jgi:hypothetical protein
MSVFRRRKGQQGPDEPVEDFDVESDAEELDDGAADDDEVDEDVDGAADPDQTRSSAGPWDAEAAPQTDEPYLDLGALRLPGGFPGVEIQVNVDQATGSVAGITVVAGDAGLQLQAFAAPRTEGIWAEVRKELAAEVTRDGGMADEVTGPFGPELRAKLPLQQPDGSRGLVTVRFVGVDGPRWFLRGVLTGRAAVEPEAAEHLETFFRSCVVVRGTDPMAPRDPLPMQLPADATPTPAEGSERPTLNPFERGPEITEVR